MKSKDYLDKISIHEGSDGVLLEGKLGEFYNLLLLEDSLLEFQCSNGVIRFDVKREELAKALRKEEFASTQIEEGKKDERHE